MIKHFLFSGLLVFLCVASCVAQDDAYKNQLGKIVEQAGGLNTFLDSNSISFATFDRWYKDFNASFEQLKNDFAKAAREKKSYILLREGADQLAQAWNMLSQAKYADDEYKDAITINDVSYAHKWKETATTQRKKALECITQALETFNRSQSALLQEE